MEQKIQEWIRSERFSHSVQEWIWDMFEDGLSLSKIKAKYILAIGEDN